ncbi:MAG: glycosyltransferase family 2 protein [Ilumatobacteraceae bacterium]
MRDLMILAVAVIGIGVAWLAFAKPLRLVQGAAGTLADGTNSSETDDVSLSVIVPARNEAGSLPTLLRSLSGSRAFEIIVVDDHSTDDTAAMAQSFGAIVIAAPDLPSDWSGKNWACSTGAAAATGTHLLFLDADVAVGPDTLDELVATHQRHGGLVSVQPFHRTERPYEELSAVFNAVAAMGSGCFSARRTDHGRAAFGPSMFVSQDDYERIGGHAAVRNEVVEDMALAIRAADVGLPVTAWLGGRSMSFRMYPDGFRSLLEGWTKNIAMGARLASPVPVAATVVWVVALAAVASAFVTGAIDWATGGSPPIAAALAWLLMVIHVRVVLSRLGSFRTLTAVLYVVPLALFIAVFIRSGWSAVRGADVTWRGRAVPSRTRRAGRSAASETRTG